MGDQNNHNRKRKWADSLYGTAEVDYGIGANGSMYSRTIEMIPPVTAPASNRHIDDSLKSFSEMDEYASSVVPPVTVVMDDRSICQRIDLCRLGSYESFYRALRRMFVDVEDSSAENECTLSNAIPGYMIAFEDVEKDLLLVGDLDWRDFVREARRIRILPVKKNSQQLQRQ